MSVPTPAELLTFLQAHGFLTPPQVQQLRGGSDTQFADARVLARELVDRNWLTPYQANQLLLGRGDDLLVGSYRIVDRLGEGGMGQVFKAHHVSMDRLVALKIIAKDRVSNPTAVARFYREVRAVAKLSHPNIVIAFEVNQVGQTPFLAMEYVEGIDLAKLVQQSGPLPIARACDYIRQAATGLQHAHEKGLVHRDIKPGNLMVTRPSPDEPPLIKILDFGLARFESETDHTTRLTQLGKVMGTMDYMAPEQAQNPRTADIRADIYSLGCTLFYLLTGRPPFEGEDTVEKIGARVLGNLPSIRKSRPEVSPALERVLSKIAARNPEDRYQTPAEVAKALQRHIQSEGESRRVARTVVDRSVAPPPNPPTLIEPRVRTSTPIQPKKEIVSLNRFDERESRPRRLKTSVWIALAGILAFGAVVFLGAIVGIIVLFANNEPGDSTTGTRPTPVVQGKPNDKRDESRPDGKPVREETDNGKSKKENAPNKQVEAKPDRDPPKSDFVELFNGKNLAGWKTYPAQPDNWRAEKGVLIGSGPTVSHLVTEHDDYKDFHLRVEARVNDGGDSGVYFRAKLGPVYPVGYEAQINSTHRDVHKTGSLYAGLGDAVVSVRQSPVPPGEWFTQEVIAEGNHIIIKINGKTTADYTDEKRLFATGYIALQQTLQTVAEFRKIEIKELPAPKQSDQVPLPPSNLPKTVTVDLGGGVKMDFVLIPKGTFTMGSPRTEQWREGQEEQHEVKFGKPFYLAKYPVTQEQYIALMKENPSWFQIGKDGANKVKGLDTKQFPVEAVSWDDAQAYCKKMRENDSQGRKFRLPTEAEWEYACRADTKTTYFFGNDAKNLGEYAWFADNSGGRPHDVGTKKPNPWGLSDMIGNVWQWCEDYYDGNYYAHSPIEDPLSIHKDPLNRRVLRGGSWNNEPMRCRAAYRTAYAHDGRVLRHGFRVCLPLD